MDRETFRRLAANRVLLLDGATGSNLLRAGMPAGICAETWILEHPGAILDLQGAYAEAGSQIIFAPTFSANAIALKERRVDVPVGELNRRLVELSRQAVGDRTLVAADMTMTGKSLLPSGTLTFDGLVDCYGEQAAALAESGVDLFVVETMVSLQEMRAAVLAIRRCCDLPILASFTVDENGFTFLGTEVTAAALVLERLGVDAVGVNCSMGPEQMLPVVKKLRKATALPVIAKANAGMPRQENGGVVYPMDEGQYTAHAAALVEAGVNLLGGCCGTTPEFIRSMREMLTERGLYIPLDHGGLDMGGSILGGETNRSEESGGGRLQAPYLATDRKRFALDQVTSLSRAGCVSDNPELIQCLCRGAYEDVVDELGDLDEGQILLVELDGLGPDVGNILEPFVAQLSASGMPVCFSASSLSVLEQALRYYCGIAAVQFSGKPDDEAVRRINKYGAVICEL